MSAEASLDDRIRALPCWQGPISIEPLPGGLTNRNHLVASRRESFVVRHGVDCAPHGIDRRAEAAISAAASRAGLAPELTYAGSGFLVFRHIAGRTLGPEDFERESILTSIVALLRRCRDEMPSAGELSLPDRRPLTILRRYQAVLAARDHPWRAAAARQAPRIAALDSVLTGRPRGFAHNDVHAGNLIDDGKRLWLIDWEYAGAGDSLIDLASLANNGPLPEAALPTLLSTWAELSSAPSTADFRSLRLAAALRDLFWGYVQAGLIGGLEDYIAINEARVEQHAAEVRVGGGDSSLAALRPTRPDS